MNPADRSGDACSCSGDVAAYALGALEPAEAEQFRAHLETCEACRKDLASFGQVVDVLPMAAPQHQAPRRLRRRVLATVRGDAKRERREQEPRRRFALGERVSLSRPVLALGLTVVVAAVVVGALELSSSSTPATTKVYAAQVIGERGTAKVAITSGHAQLIVRNFSPPPPGKIYEVWLSKVGHTSPSATGVLFSVTSSGNGDVDVPGSMRGVAAVLVTPEPAGGSPVPTHRPVINAKLS